LGLRGQSLPKLILVEPELSSRALAQKKKLCGGIVSSIAILIVPSG
jgi:hypothetical protein